MSWSCCRNEVAVVRLATSEQSNQPCCRYCTTAVFRGATCAPLGKNRGLMWRFCVQMALEEIWHECIRGQDRSNLGWVSRFSINSIHEIFENCTRKAVLHALSRTCLSRKPMTSGTCMYIPRILWKDNEMPVPSFVLLLTWHTNTPTQATDVQCLSLV